MKVNYFTISFLILFCISLQAKNQYILKLDSKKGSYIDGELITKDPINGVAEIDARIIISEPGTFVLTGNYTSQIKVTLTDPDGYVTLILNGTNITNPLGPAILFTKTHEMDPTEYSKEKPITYEKAMSLNFSDAGSKLIISDDTENIVVGYYSEKFDGALYSKTSMASYGGKKGNGKLTIFGNCDGCEGLDSDLHMEINGGIINIASGDDGINASEDFGSAVIINGGKILINAGSYSDRGDGIDANGILIINGGELVVSANSRVDAGLEGEVGIYVNGGRVMTVGNPLHSADPGSEQVTMNLFFGFEVNENSVLTIEDKDKNVLLSFCPAKAGYLEGTELHRYAEATISIPEFDTFTIYKVFLDGKPLGFSNRQKGYGFFGGFGGDNQFWFPDSIPIGQIPQGGDGFPNIFRRGSDNGKNKDKRSNNYYKIKKDNGNILPELKY